jgi:hypothetical protein
MIPAKPFQYFAKRNCVRKGFYMKAFGFTVRLSLCLACALFGWAQNISTSQIQGTVRDASGLGVPGAEVKVTQSETGVVRTANSGAGGQYVLPNLPVGPYRMEVSKEGFSKYVQTGIVLQVGTNPTVDPALKIGNVSESVQVEANAALVETQATGIGAVIENQRILELPLNGRNPTDLVQLSAGAVYTAPAVSRSFGGANGGQAIAVAGGQSFSTTYLLDGAFHNNPYDNLNLPLPFPDALQEFKVETSSLTAQNGVHSGAAVNAVTRSGTNAFHGDLFEFIRNGDFNARNFFAAKRDSLKRNQYGGTAGGRIIKDKLFFFGGYQGTRTRQDPAATTPAVIPTAQMLAGDFTAFASCYKLNLPSPFVDNKIDPALLSKAAINISKRLPTTSNPCGRFPYGVITDQNEYQIVGRVDYSLNSKHSLFGRYMATAYKQPAPYSIEPDDLLVTTTGGRDNLAQSATFGHTFLISSTMVNSFRAVFNRTAIHRLNAPSFGPADVGIQGVFTYQPDNFLLTMPAGSGFSLGGGTESESTFRTTTYQLGNDFNLVHGTHQFAFGAELAMWPSTSLANVRSPGVYSFNGQVTGSALTDFLLGRLQQLDQSAPNNLFMKQWYFGAYAQDTWKIRPGLTLNYGVRWEPWFPPIITNNAIYNFDINRFLQGVKSTVYTTAPAGFLYPGDAGFPGQSGINKQWGNLAPRVGLAWDPKGDGKTSIRASWGLAYDFVNAQQNLNTSIAPPFGDEIRTNFGPGGLDNPYLNFPGGNPFPISFDPKNALYVPFGPFLTTPYDLKTAQVNLWNLTIQRQIGQIWVVSASYVGNQTAHLLASTALNPAVFVAGTCAAGQYGLTAPGPCSSAANVNQRRLFTQLRPQDGQFIGYMDQFDDGTTQSYNGMVLSAERRLSHNVSASANYTWSHCISNDRWGAGGTTQNVAQTYLDPLNRNFERGDCTFDRRHIFNLTAVAQMPRFNRTALRMLASGWQVAGIVRYQSGAALTVTDQVDRQLSLVSGQRPVQVLPNVYGDGSTGRYLNPAAFALPALGTLGNMSPGSVRGPGFSDISLSLSRTFPIRERMKLDFRVDAFNLPNSFRAGCQTGSNCSAINGPGFGGYISTSFGAGNFGQITSAMDPRIIQLSAKFVF